MKKIIILHSADIETITPHFEVRITFLWERFKAPIQIKCDQNEIVFTENRLHKTSTFRQSKENADTHISIWDPVALHKHHK